MPVAIPDRIRKSQLFFVMLTIILAFVFLHESITVKSVIGMILITAGTLFMVL